MQRLSSSFAALRKLAVSRPLASFARASSSSTILEPTMEIAAYPGAVAAFTQKLEFVKGHTPMPVYRIMDFEGNVVNHEDDPKLPDELAVRMYENMARLNVMDNILYDAQRQGRISFYMTNYGEEAAQVGSAAALVPDDEIFAQYREAGVLLWRGFTLDNMLDQCFGTKDDLGKGRQMPVHYGSRALHFQTISSPLGTQIPQAAGAAYAMKLAGRDNVVMCYFGDGAASEGDFHAAMNFAATLECPTLFFCRNNGYAISTPTHEQYRGDGIVSRGLGYGMHSVRVDGNDLLAVYKTVRAARDLAVKDKVPVLIEAMTYRGGHHSTSDDSSRYRSKDELALWRERHNPIIRFRKHLERRGLWNAEKEQAVAQEMRAHVLRTLDRAEKTEVPQVEDMFEDVFDVLPWNLREQKRELLEHIAKYPEHYKQGAGGGH